jgi:hypothetical protein
MEVKYHKNAAKGKWFHLSLIEQMANIGSEVGRAARWQGQDENLFQGAVERALELFDLTMADPRWVARKRLREIGLARELFCDGVYGGKEYGTSLHDLERYFFPFAFASRKDV